MILPLITAWLVIKTVLNSQRTHKAKEMNSHMPRVGAIVLQQQHKQGKEEKNTLLDMISWIGMISVKM